MPTWTEMKEFVRSKYKLSKDEQDWFSMVWAYDNKRTQLIVVSKFEAFSKEWVLFRSRCCKKTEMSMEVALKKNRGWAIGFLAIEDDHYVFCHTAPLASMDLDEFELPLSVIARSADEIEATYSGGDEH